MVVPNSVVDSMGVGGHPFSVAVNPNSNMIYVDNQGYNTISIIKGTTSKSKNIVPVGSTPDGVTVNPKTKMVYVVNYNDNTTSVIDGSTNSVVKTVKVGKNPDYVDCQSEDQHSLCS